MLTKEIKIKLKDKDKEKEFNIGNIIEYEAFIKKINSIIEEEYIIKMKETNNLYKMNYIDEDSDKIQIKNKEDFDHFIDLEDLPLINLEINESLMNSIILEEFKKVKKQNDSLKKVNNYLKQRNEATEELSNLRLEKIKILETEKENEILKSQILVNSLENEQKEKNAIIEQLEETKKLNESIQFINNNSLININNNEENKNEDKAMDILLNNLKEENKMLKSHLEEEKRMINEYKTLQEEQLNEYKNKINQSTIIIGKKDDEINKIKNIYENKINNIKEKEVEQKLSKIYIECLKPVQESEINIQKINDNNEINTSISNISRISQCNTIHNEIKCDGCGICPITGYRYKCLECPNYNLCDQCEKSVSHEHNFIRYVIEESEVIKNEKKYLYECLTTKLSVYAYAKSENADMSIIIKNSGVAEWTENTKLICDKDNKASFNDIILKPLKPGEFNSVQITFDKINDLPPATYTSKLLFSVDDKIYGEPLKIDLIIIERNK